MENIYKSLVDVFFIFVIRQAETACRKQSYSAFLSEHLAAQSARQTNETTINVKNKSSNPEMIAPTMLVAANVIPRSITEVNIVPSIPVRRVGSTLHTQHLEPYLRMMVVIIGVKARYTTAIPNNTHKKAGVTVMVAAKVRNAVITPTIILAIIATKVQSLLHPQS